MIFWVAQRISDRIGGVFVSACNPFYCVAMFGVATNEVNAWRVSAIPRDNLPLSDSPEARRVERISPIPATQ